MFFINNSQIVGGDKGNILFRIGEGCATNCYNCTSAFDRISYKPYSSYEDVFKHIQNICDKNLLIFFYGVEAIYHPEIELFILNDNLKGYQKSLHITPLFSIDRLKKILNLSKKYKEISFDTCYTIKNKEDLMSFLNFFAFLKLNNIKATLDIFFDYDKYFNVITYFLNKFDKKILNKPINTHLGNERCIEYTFNNANQVLLLYHTKPQFVMNNKIYNLSTKFCAVKKSFIIDDEKILTSEEIEFTEKGDITVHFSTYCSKGIQKISSIYKNKKEIIEDFKKFDKYLEKYSSGDMGKNCYNCISNPYNNEK